MHFRGSSRLLALIIATVAGVVILIHGPAARAATVKPPFEIVFPQEAAVTEFTSSFGDYRSGGRRHHGNDLLAPRMTEVYAVADGVVTYVGINRLSGRNIKIEHADGWMSYYVHLNNDTPGTDDGDAPWTLTVAPGIEEGMHVLAGQLIGWVGDSGNAETTTPHTHFELRLDDRPIDPNAILREAQARALNRKEWLEHLLEGHHDPFLIE